MGNSEEFARRMNVSASQLFQDIKDMRELGVPIKFSSKLNTYYYENDSYLIFEFKGSEAIKGGQSCYAVFINNPIELFL